MSLNGNKETQIINVEGENAHIVARAYQAFNSADMQTLTELFHENASWHTPGRSPIAGDSEGREAAFAQFGRYVGDTSGTFKATLQNVFESEDDRVVGVHHNSAERGRQAFGYGLLHRIRAEGRPDYRR